jgi:N-acetylglutamate synthase-like GNAT family acetyltransferase/DNA-binding MarR family transcriptional regulator
MSIDINVLRQSSRSLLREWGIHKLVYQHNLSPSHAHTLLEIQAGVQTISELSRRLILDVSTLSRIIDKLTAAEFVLVEEQSDRRVKQLSLTRKGRQEVARIDQFSNRLINDAFAFVSPDEQEKIMQGIMLYAQALEKSRLFADSIDIRTLRKDKRLRQRIADMVYAIQRQEFGVEIGPEVNSAIINAEDSFYYKNKCNFWYAIGKDNKIAGCIGLKAVNNTCGELSKCFVSPEFRGKGLSQRLVNKLIKQAKKLGMEKVYIGTVDYFSWAHRFYEKMGFKRIAVGELPPEFNRCPVDSVFFCGELSQL